MIYLISQWYDLEKKLIIVPTVGLVSQFESDLRDYGFEGKIVTSIGGLLRSDDIDADIVRSFDSYGIEGRTRNVLQFTNVDATLYGVKVNLLASIYESKQLGSWQLEAKITNTRGSRNDTNQPLYQIKPLQTQLGLSQKIGRFENLLTWQWVDNKSRVDDNRFENQTDSYNLVNFSSVASWDALTVSVEVANILDEYYQQPLGGVNIAQFKKDKTNHYEQLAGQGRSINIGVSYTF